MSETTVYTLKTSNFNWNNHDDPSTFGAPYLFRKPLFVTRCGKTIDKPNNLRIHEPICELVSFSWRIPGVSLVWCSRRIFTQQYCIVHWQSHDQKLAWTRPNTLHHVKKPDRHCCVTTGQLHDITTCTILVATFGYWMFAD